MFKRLKETILEIIQQADLILLGLCCAASVFGIAMIYSATRYNNDNQSHGAGGAVYGADPGQRAAGHRGR